LTPAAVFNGLVGQDKVVSELEKAISSARSNSSGQEMTHAWLFTGPPGSGRSNIAKAFAASLVCSKSGCGTCTDCKSALAGSHQDVELFAVNGLAIKVDEIREIVARSAWSSSVSRWRVIVIEDCDRMTEAAGNALLRAIEEPGTSTVWLLCAPTLHDVLPTIRSRCRHIQLRTPSKSEVTEFLISNLGVSKKEATFAAELSQGHIGKARSYILDKSFKSTRQKLFQIFFSVTSEKKALQSAQELIDLAEARVESKFAELIEKESESSKSIYQGAGRGLAAGGSKALKELERDQKARTTRAIKDELDGYLLEYTSALRDCLVSKDQRLNYDLAEELENFSSKISPEGISKILSDLGTTRNLLNSNTSQTLLLEGFFLKVYRATSGH